MKDPFVIKLINSEYPTLDQVIQYSVGEPSPDNVKKVLASYQGEQKYILGCFQQNKLVGMIGFEVEQTRTVIHHISVLPAFRLQGIGCLLIETMKHQYHSQEIVAETDDDAVEFYRNLGFHCFPIKSKWAKRYKCIGTGGY